MAGLLPSVRRAQLSSATPGRSRTGELLIPALLGVIVCGFTEGLAVIALGILGLALVITRDSRVGAALLTGVLTFGVTLLSPGNAVRIDAIGPKPGLGDALLYSFLYLRGSFTPTLPAYGLCFMVGAATGTLRVQQRRLLYTLLTFLIGVFLAALTLFPVVLMTGAISPRALLPAQFVLACAAFVIGSITWPKKRL